MFVQIAIAVLGGLAVLLVNIPTTTRYAVFFGLASQPFWIYSTWVESQWGMFALAWVYAGGWIIGIYHHWIKRTPP